MTINAYSVGEVARVVGGRCVPRPDDSLLIRFLLCDSRKLVKPESSLFFALRTQSNDGHRFVSELLHKGVKAFVVQNIQDNWLRNAPDACFIIHSDPLEALQKLAAYHRVLHKLSVIGITGSNGKTVVKEWLHQLMSGHKSIVRNPKSFNSQIGVPLSVWLIEEKHELGIFEAGISKPGEMQKLKKILNPQLGILTNIGSAHDEGFLSREQKLHEKLLLFRSCNTLVYCIDHLFVKKELISWQKSNPTVKLFAWGKNKEADLQIIDIEKAGNNTMVTLSAKEGSFLVSIPFHDDASVENALHCIALMKHIGFADRHIIKHISGLQTVAMRLEMKEGVNNSTIINDSYNSDLQSLKIALDFLEGQTVNKNKTLILSDILQTGIPAQELYTEVASILQSKKINRLIGIGPEISSQKTLFDESAKFFNNTDEFINCFDLTGFHNETILLKGARVFGFERLDNLLQQKDHQTVLEINLDALTHNLSVYRSLLKPGTKLMSMVKAFSYGSGSVEIARMLQYHNTDYLAVAYADEGKVLRRGGIDIPIVVMNPEIRTFETLLVYQLEPEVYGFPLLNKLIDSLKHLENGMYEGSLAIHLKLDTGMHRLGFMAEELDELTAVLLENPSIRVASVFSHLAASDDPEHDAFTISQINLFKQLCLQLEGKLGYSFIKHIANSAAISRFPDAQLDMVRPGIGLYGVSGDPTIQQLLQHVSTLRSVVSQVKRIRKGSSIGYGRKTIAVDDIEIAIVPIGYADGLNRRLGNGRGKLMVKGKKATILGNISMDMCTIDVSALDVKEGDEVIIFGKDMPVSEMAKELDTIPYEVLTSVSHRVKRVYYQG